MQNEQSFNLAGRKLFVALPAYDFKVSLKLAVSLARLAQQLPQHGVDMSIGSICGCSVVSRARNLLVKDFLESNCTDLMFIDADINFEPEDVLRLMAWASDPKMGIVGGVPRTRKTNKVYIAQLDQDEEGLTMNRMGLVRAKLVNSIDVKDGTVRVSVALPSGHQFAPAIKGEIMEKVEPLWDVNEVVVEFED